MQKKRRRWISPLELPRRWRGLLTGGAVAVFAHLIALAGLDWTWGGPDAVPPAARPVQLRALTFAAPALLEKTPPSAAVEATGSVPVPAAKQALKSTRAAPPAASPKVTARAGPPPVTPVRLADAPSADTASTEAAVDEEAIPNYRTLIPAPVTLRYHVWRGLLEGSGDLRWHASPDGYELTLDIDAGGGSGGPALLSQASRGGFDAAGLAPARFTEKRLRRPASAANFQRDAGKISFSGPATEYPLRAGSQDRLSWLLQLAAIVAAEPALREKGARVLMNVVGAHGDAGVWAFVCDGADDDGSGSRNSSATGAGPLAYRREPRGPYDTAVAVSLDPLRGYLPSSVTLRSGASGDGFELRLQDGAPRP